MLHTVGEVKDFSKRCRTAIFSDLLNFENANMRLRTGGLAAFEAFDCLVGRHGLEGARSASVWRGLASPISCIALGGSGIPDEQLLCFDSSCFKTTHSMRAISVPCLYWSANAALDSRLAAAKQMQIAALGLGEHAGNIMRYFANKSKYRSIRK